MSRWVYVYDDPSLLSSRAHYGLLLVSKFVSIELSNCKYKYSVLVIHSHLIWLHYEKGGSGFSCFWANQGSTWNRGGEGFLFPPPTCVSPPIRPNWWGMQGGGEGAKEREIYFSFLRPLACRHIFVQIGGNPVWTKQESISEKRVRVGLSHDNDQCNLWLVFIHFWTHWERAYLDFMVMLVFCRARPCKYWV